MTLINSSLPVFNKKCRAGGTWKKKIEDVIKKIRRIPAPKVQKILASKKDWDFPVQKLAGSLVAAKELMER